MNSKQERKHRRCEKRRAKSKDLFNSIKRYLDQGLTLSEARHDFKYGYFIDSRGDYVQVCSYEGICSYPCNGDC